MPEENFVDCVFADSELVDCELDDGELVRGIYTNVFLYMHMYSMIKAYTSRAVRRQQVY